MELGGLAPGIICEDADIDSVLETIYFMRFSDFGQMCDGLKRLIVHASRYDEVIEKLTEISIKSLPTDEAGGYRTYRFRKTKIHPRRTV